MECPNCGASKNHQVVESRSTARYISRRRKCLTCKNRFSTREQLSDLTEAKALKEDRRGAVKSFRLLREDHAVLWENQAMMIGLLRRLLRHSGADDSIVGLIKSLPVKASGPPAVAPHKARKKQAA